MQANKTIQLKLYPNKTQEAALLNNIHTARYTWNKLLQTRQEHYTNTGSMLWNHYNDIINEDSLFLKTADSCALKRAEGNLNQAYKNYFSTLGKKGKKYNAPKFKSRHKCKWSYTTDMGIKLDKENRKLKLPKITSIRYRGSWKEPGVEYKVKRVTITRTTAGDYMASVLIQYDKQVPELVQVKGVLGLDYSSSNLYVDSNGEVGITEHYYREAEAEIARLSKALSRKKKGSNRYNKIKKQLARMHEKVKNRRKDYLDKLSHRLALLYDLIVVEDLDLTSIARFGHLGKSTYDNAFGLFRSMLEYKLSELGKVLLKADKWYPSTQLCSDCGCKTGPKDLGTRSWVCSSCGCVHDRDVNAAVNLALYGVQALGLSDSLVMPLRLGEYSSR